MDGPPVAAPAAATDGPTEQTIGEQTIGEQTIGEQTIDDERLAETIRDPAGPLHIESRQPA